MRFKSSLLHTHSIALVRKMRQHNLNSVNVELLGALPAASARLCGQRAANVPSRRTQPVRGLSCRTVHLSKCEHVLCCAVCVQFGNLNLREIYCEQNPLIKPLTVRSVQEDETLSLKVCSLQRSHSDSDSHSACLLFCTVQFEYITCLLLDSTRCM